MAESEAPPLTPYEENEVEERTPPRAAVVHAAVSRQGEDELERPGGSLFWSGLMAGIAITASLVAEAALREKLPPGGWSEIMADLGYTIGFLIVILGRMQLFTENTLVAILPLAREPGARNIKRVSRLWSIVFAGNILGAALAAAASAWGHIQSPALLASMIHVSSELLDKGFAAALLQAVPAGFLIAAVAWIRSASDNTGFWVIVVLTYTIALGGFGHVIVGASEAFLLLFTGQASLGWVLGGFLLPVLIGNVIGGTLLFAVLAHAQVKAEI